MPISWPLVLALAFASPSADPSSEPEPAAEPDAAEPVEELVIIECFIPEEIDDGEFLQPMSGIWTPGPLGRQWPLIQLRGSFVDVLARQAAGMLANPVARRPLETD